MLFIFNHGKNTTKTNQLICQGYGKNAAVAISTIKKWFKKLRNGDFDLNDETRSLRLQQTKDVELQELLDKDTTQSTRDLVKRLQINQLTIQTMDKILQIGHWVPHKLTDRLNTCVTILHVISLVNSYREWEIYIFW